jgi:hypothetical protein
VPDRALSLSRRTTSKPELIAQAFLLPPDAQRGPLKKSPEHRNDVQGSCRKEQAVPLLLVRHAKELL